MVIILLHSSLQGKDMDSNKLREEAPRTESRKFTKYGTPVAFTP